MNSVKTSKLYFNDLLELNARSSIRTWKKKLILEKIDEISELSDDIIIQPPRTQTSLKYTTHLFTQNYSQRSLFLKNFLTTLSKHPKVYTYFILRALKSNIISHQQLKKKTIQKPNEHTLNSIKKYSPDTSLSSDDDDDSSKIMNSTLSISKSARGAVLHAKTFNLLKKKIEIPQITSSSDSSSMSLKGTANNKFGILRKRVTLKSADPKMRKVFNAIADGKAKITGEDFVRFLNLRYPAQISEAIGKFFSFKQWVYADYLTEMNKFIAGGELKQLRFCFDIFDFDKDKKITIKDAYSAMEIRKGNHYDDDIVLIMDMFELKKEGKLKNNKDFSILRRRSTFGLMGESLQKKEIKIDIAEDQSDNTAGLSFKEFCMIKFRGRPQILQDFLLYTCKYNFMIERGIIERSPLHSAKNSENIVMEMNLNPEFYEKISKNDKFEYYCALDASMQLFSRFQLEDMLKKFKFLMADEKFKIKVITKDSMIEKLPKLLGYKNDYLAIRLYQIFSQNRDLSKSTFLFKVNSLISNTTPFTINKFAFDIYDSRSDGKLTVDEAHKMYEALPMSSKAFQECNNIVEVYIQAIFERSRERLNCIEFPRFSELVGVSCLGQEFIDMLNTPFENCFERTAKAFQTGLLSPEDTTKFYETKSSLLSISE